MKHTVIFIAATAVCTILGCASSAPPIPQTASNLCMAETVSVITQAVNSNAKVLGHISRESICSTRVQIDSLWEKSTSPNSSASVGVGVAIAITNNVTIGKRSRSELMAECLRDASIKSQMAPPAFTQFSRVVFGLENHSVNSCPADFQQAFSAYVDARRNATLLARDMSPVTSQEWTNLAYDVKFINYSTATQYVMNQEVRTLRVPGSELEKSVVNAEKSIASSYHRLRAIQAKHVGRCYHQPSVSLVECS